MHFHQVNPEIDLSILKLQVPVELMDWPSTTEPRRAGINSFGYGGSNAHVILESYRSRGRSRTVRSHLAKSNTTDQRPFLIPLTSHTERAAKVLTSKFSEYLQHHPGIHASDFAHSLSTRRTMHQYRSFAIGYDSETIWNGMVAPNANAKWRKALEGSCRLGFVFTGQGEQWYAMGRQLIELSTTFRNTLERCDQVLHALPDSPSWSCIDELLLSEKCSRLSQSNISQPVCAALQIAIVDLLATWNIKPAAVIGHSSGEIAASYAAGILTLDNAIICAYYRGLYMSKGVNESEHPRGAMIAVGLSLVEGVAELKDYVGRIALAAINGPSSLTLSGDESAILELKKALEKKSVFVKRLRVEQAFHSHHMTPLAIGFERSISNCAGFEVLDAKCQMHSSVTARDSSARKMDASYWSANMTGVVRFSDALTGIALDDADEQNVDILVEIGAHPALKRPSEDVLKSLNLDMPYIASLTRQLPAYESLLATAGQLFALGYPVDLPAVNSTFSTNGTTDMGNVAVVGTGIVRDLPTYPWDHNRFWAKTRNINEYRFRQHLHSVLGAPIPGTPVKHPRWRNFLRQNELPWLSQHVVDGKVVFPGAGYVSMAIEAIATQIPEFQSIQLKDVVFKSPLIISDGEMGTEVALELEPQVSSAKNTSHKWSRFVFYSFNEEGKTVEHSSGLIAPTAGSPSLLRTLEVKDGLNQSRVSANHRKSRHAYYKKLRTLGLQYGNDFQLISGDIASGEGLATAPLTFRPSNVVDTKAASCILHPTLLDASFHVILAAIENLSGKTASEMFIPSYIRSMTVSGLLNQTKYSLDEQDFWVKSQSSLPGPRTAINSLSLQSGTSNDVLVEMLGFEMTALGESSRSDEATRTLFFKLRWQAAFEQFGSCVQTAPFQDLSKTMDIFAHQFPNARILHVTDSIASTREVLCYLGGTQRRRRRFQSLTPYSTSLNVKELVSVLEAERPGLISLDTPNEKECDLIIATGQFDVDLLPLLKDNGYLLSGAANPDTRLLRQVFRAGRFSAWQKATSTPSLIDLVTILVSENSSKKTELFVSNLRARYGNSVNVRTMAEVDQITAQEKNIISLLSLDESILWNVSPTDSVDFYALRGLLTKANKNIIWLTNGATQEHSNPAQSLAIGLLRAVRSENENIRIISLDLPAKYDVHESCSKVLKLLDQSLSGDEFALRDGILYVPRVEIDDKRNEKLPNGGNRRPHLEPFHQDRKLALKIGKVGLLDTLSFEDDEDVLGSSELGDNDVEIEVRASALNFRDIAASMGLIDDFRLGDECSGVVIRTGRHVKESDIKVGDRVLATRPGQGAHRSIVRNPAILCQKIGDMEFANATALGGVFATAYYSLVNVARLQAGEYCLIHSAAGGVGQMAIQIAQLRNAKVIATVGSEDKRKFLRQRFGIEDEMIFSSRDTSFGKGVMKVTNGRGCDVALNSLAGELLHETWRSIAPFGRLIEIGKRDIHENTKLDMDPFRKNITYASVDLVTIYHHDKPLLARLIEILFELVAQGKIIHPQPLTTISYGEAQKAFRQLQMGKHFGKIVMIPEENGLVPVLPPSYRNTALFKSEKVYLLVGGLGGIGRSLAEWMLRRGARRLAFLSRSGVDKQDAKDTVAWLKAKGVELSVIRGDVAEMDTVFEVVQQLGDNLAGIFQAAMVLRDAPYSKMTLEDWRECADSKVRGTWNLHMATISCKLDFFVCFSSSAAILGSLAQANYSAANSYIDALMGKRQVMGLPGITMNVGMVSGVGVVAEDVALEKTMDRLGYEAITEEELFYQIEEAIITSATTVSQTSNQQGDWSGCESHRIITGINLQRKDLYWATKPIFHNLYTNLDLEDNGGKAKRSQNLALAIQNAKNSEERAMLLMTAFLDKVASVLSMPVTSIQPENSLSNYGLDSIVAVEFRKWFFKVVKVDVALFDIIGSKSITSLVEKVNSVLVQATVKPQAGTPSGADQEVQPQESAGAALATRGSVEEFRFNETSLEKVPLSAFQTRLWSTHKALKDPSVLNLTITCYVEGKLDFSILRQALSELANRNQILRMAYSDCPGAPEQRIVDTLNALVEFQDASEAESSQAIIDSCIDRTSQVPLDIRDGEVMRVTHLKLREAKHAIVLVVHHIAIDNGSTASTLSQLIAIYDALRSGADLSQVAAPKVSYTDYALWTQRRLVAGLLDADLGWWAGYLRGAPRASTLLPFAQGPRLTHRSAARQAVRNTLPAALLRRMKRIATTGATTATPFHFLLAVLRAFLHRYTNEDDVTLLLVDGTRPHPALDDVLGYFVNLIPLRCGGGCSGGFDRYLSRVVDGVLGVMAHGGVPFEEIVRAAGADAADRDCFPLGQIAVNYQARSPAPSFGGQAFRVEKVTVKDMPGACELAVEATEDDEGALALRIEFDCGLYSKRHMERFWDNFLIFLTQVIKDHRQPLEEVRI